MIESGIFDWVLGNLALQPLLGQSSQEKSNGKYSSFYFSFINKDQPMPGVILDRLKSDEADDTLDVRTSAPGMIVEGKFQFGSVAVDSAGNPANFSGYLSAALLSNALRLQIMGLATGISELPDLTVIKELRIDDEYDAHFEVGGLGYVYRRILAVTIWYVS